jgi:hypothetical protein
MALCALRQEKAFPHPVEGYIDWQPSRAYIVSKLDSNGMPGECVVYTHDDDIALVNDSEKGQKKLLADLIANGPRKIVLLPIRKRAPVKPDPINHGWKPEDQRKSKRSPDKVLHLRGAQRRFAIAQRGGVDEAKIEKLLERKGKKGKQLKIPFGEAATG